RTEKTMVAWLLWSKATACARAKQAGPHPDSWKPTDLRRERRGSSGYSADRKRAVAPVLITVGDGITDGNPETASGILLDEQLTGLRPVAGDKHETIDALMLEVIKAHKVEINRAACHPAGEIMVYTQLGGLNVRVGLQWAHQTGRRVEDREDDGGLVALVEGNGLCPREATRRRDDGDETGNTNYHAEERQRGAYAADGNVAPRFAKESHPSRPT
ncbi:MAG TPA: hypothetical protein VER55_02540, partial [Ardenticatenaceae bacterium]|nr:hypothetical protein [Ardenticatenaceae bacterium]